MNMNEQRLIDRREFRVTVIALAAVAVLALAAYWFGTGLRADTAASVAPSPLGSSLTAIRESRSEDFVGRLARSSEAARAASTGLSTAEYAAKFDIPAASVNRSESLEAVAERWANFYAELDKAMVAAGARP